MINRVQAFGTFIDNVTMGETIEIISGWVENRENKCPYVVTPNIDHIVQLHSNRALQIAYNNASLVLTDGKPVYFFLRLLGKPIKETVPGSDLAPALFRYWNSRDKRLKIFLLGGIPGVGEQAAANIAKKWPSVEIVGLDSPPLGFEESEHENDRIINKINKATPDILVICLGAPKQELWVQRFQPRLKISGALCIGATIDFMAGSKKRAPVVMRKLALEWLFRMCSDPKRLVRRYVKDALLFPGILWQEWKRTKM